VKKVALVFVIAVFVPSLILAWLAVLSVRDQQFILERQQTLLAQGIADAVAKDVIGYVESRREEFSQEVEAMLAKTPSRSLAGTFHQQLRERWPLAEVGFTVTLNPFSCSILSPQLFEGPECRTFRLENDRFLTSQEPVEVYWNNLKPDQIQQRVEPADQDAKQLLQKKSAAPQNKERVVAPQKDTVEAQVSKIFPGQAEFRELVGNATQGMLARFLQDQLKLLFWYRSQADTQLLFGVQVQLPRLVEEMKKLIRLDPALQREFVVALLDDNAHPRRLSEGNFMANWKRPFVSTEIGEWLPHWEVAVYQLNPGKLTQSARALKWTLGLLITVLVGAIAIGSWLIVTDLRRQLALARQKTDFVSNVSHELKTPLTSIRMFSELLADGRVQDSNRQRDFLKIINAETARLTRLINNVLDFARMERGEKKYHFAPQDLRGLIEEVCATYRPHLEANGFAFKCKIPDHPLIVNGDRDALAQILVNLISNAEKYSSEERKEISVQATNSDRAEVCVLDRGLGVPKGCEQRIFDQFYRAHDSLASGIQGSGLGLTLARQIASAHGGHIEYAPREDGGSCFVLRLPKLNS
jgi:signal transduction histidine kinase